VSRSGDPPPAPRLERTGARMAADVAGFHEELANRLLAGARERLAAAGLPKDALDVHRVPGCFEVPLAAKTLAGTGRYAAVIGLGVVIRGETAHFDHVAGAASTGLLQAGLETGVPCTFGVLTCETMAQAEARAGGAVGNAGADAADAAVVMANLVGAAATG
jgi:6,7-dimethyl-8-ribityllumazine synthase